jgi:hypothetical protein
MITFTSFPKPKDSFSYAPPKFSTVDENDMDTDVYEDDDDGEDFDSGTKLTCPGESITSSLVPSSFTLTHNRVPTDFALLLSRSLKF